LSLVLIDNPFECISLAHVGSTDIILRNTICDRLCGLVIRVPGYRAEMYCVSCEVRTEFIYVMQKKVDRLCGLVVRVPGYTTEMYCVSCEVRTQFICYVEESRPPLWSSGQSSWLQIRMSGFDFRRYQIF
jgi:hypothetical protein